MNPLELVELVPLMNRTRGRPEIVVALIDGPVLLDNGDLAIDGIREVTGKSGSCSRASSAACMHGTFVAGILSAKRDSAAPAICPDCTLLVRPIFSESASRSGEIPSATPDELAEAIVDCVDAGARVLNMSIGLAQASMNAERNLQDALDYASMRGAIAVAAAGNQGTVGSSAITRHPSVIPVAACDLEGRPSAETNLGNSIGRRGLMAPGENITSLGTGGTSQAFHGTSAATPFVTGAIALLWSEFPAATANEVKTAVLKRGRRNTVVPPLLMHGAHGLTGWVLTMRRCENGLRG